MAVSNIGARTAESVAHWSRNAVTLKRKKSKSCQPTPSVPVYFWCEPPNIGILANLPAKLEDVLEADEMWSFVQEKWNERWLWTILCRRTRQIAAFVIGDRSEATCRKLWEQIPQTYKGCQSYSDFWKAYQLVFPEETHQCAGKDSGQTNHMER